MSIASEVYKYDALTIEDLFKNSFYDVPRYQRGYAWKASKQVDELLTDFSTAITEEPENLYFLGEVTVVKKTPVDLRQLSVTYEVIDGQQRLTTIQILLICIQRRLSLTENSLLERALSEANARFEYQVLASRYQERDDDHSLRFRVQLTERGKDVIDFLGSLGDKPNTEIRKYLNTKGLKDPSQARLIDAWQYIDSYLEKNYSDTKELCHFMKFVLTRTVLVRLAVAQPDQALNIFWKSNGRGLPLSDADLLKNMLFMNTSDELFKELGDKWNAAIEALYVKKGVKQDSMVPFLKMWAQILAGKNVGQGEVFSFWNSLLNNGFDEAKASQSEARWPAIQIEPGIQSTQLNRAERTSNFADLLPVRADQLSAIVECKTPHAKNDVSGISFGTQYLNIRQHHEVLLAGQHLSGAAYEELVRIVDTRTMLYQLSEEKTQAFERLLHPWSHLISRLPEDATKRQILENSLPALEDLDGLFRSMRVKLQNLNYETSTHVKPIRYVLARVAAHVQFRIYGEQTGSFETFLKDHTLSSAGSAPEIDSQSDASGSNRPAYWQIDHVFPKADSLSETFASRLQDWIKVKSAAGELSDNDAVGYRNYHFIHSLGNLSLLKSSHNLELSMDLPESSKKIGFYTGKSQTLLINDAISSQTVVENSPRKYSDAIALLRGMAPTDLVNWGPEAILMRFNLYAELLERDFRSILQLQ